MKKHHVAYGVATRPVLAAGLILMVPLLTMQVTDDVAWDVFDFAVAGTLLAGTGIAFEVALKMSGNAAYRLAAGIALLGGLLLTWMALAVGIIGAEDNSANLMYAGVLGVEITGALIARLRPHGMARALIATALAQALVALIAVIGSLGSPDSGRLEVLALNGFFVALWVASALMFGKAATAGDVDREPGIG
jgi:hypothetical protein